MPRISKSGGAGMIGGVRSPMASSGHGLVGKSKLKPSIAANTTRPDVGRKAATIIHSPMNRKAIVP
jgi:hypothetical protein